ncbi:MAG TPA: isoleucine--tRNA ligase [Acidobacteriaceae bacterium]|jgi:isoleucyl-tRNA synthetase|nr:isoleucine--tRNA ligase [Acidobacteriaceae bacterium]
MPDVPSAQQEAQRLPQRLPKQLKETLNLPRTDFPMKANLPTREPERLAAWESADLYQQIRSARAGAARYVLHDGPPYANGAIHLGHALNKCIKDFVVKTKTMAGFDAPYVPGWDCHGLPIEIKVDEQLGGRKLELNPLQVRQACRDYAQKYIDLQRSQFKRLGVLGRWDIPYSTMNFAYEARIAETFFGFYEKGFVYKGLKPVYWCWHDRTALAEAEVEYEIDTSPSVYVRYKLTSRPEQIDPRLAGREVYTIIWTTTPWTLPASMAVAFNPEFEYVAMQVESGALYIVAEELQESTCVACNIASWTEIARFPGSKLDRVTFAHPFLNRSILGVLADYVTTEQGTGAVHTAPAHGPDDFATGQKYDLPLTCNVDAQGKLRNGLPEYDGLFVFKANAPIIRLLEERGALMGHHNLEHKYPHCWRCHNPLIFRATEQWFISMETPVLSPREGKHQTSFRQRALDEIKRVAWDPSWGEERISNMVATRPDWCISRQRIWGVPIAVFLCDTCHEPLNNASINQSIVALFDKDGADAWYKHSVAELLPKNTACPNCNGTSFRKETDILDVWFESGASWRAVLEVEPELAFPCDLYAEGGDQHRGWFQSSLLNAVGLRDISPFRRAITIGWTLGEDGSALSKSLGNGVDPVEVADRMGAEIIRLWVASVDFREDVVASENIMQRVSENYRKLRNTLRFLLSNLSDFTPATDSIAFSAMQPLDQYILARTAELDASIRSAYEEFEFHRAYQALNEFINADLSALYLDVIKDRLYTLAPHSAQRRSAQTTLWRIAEALTRLIAPILSFTADEVWQYLPQVPSREPSVHLALFPDVADIVPGRVAGLEDEWAHLLRIRELVNVELEALRADKSIGKGLDAAITLIATEGSDENLVLRRYEDQLPEFLNVSQVTVQSIAATKDAAAVLIEASVASGSKCGRCWRVVLDVGADSRWPSVCARCAEALDAIHFAPLNQPQPGEPQPKESAR